MKKRYQQQIDSRTKFTGANAFLHFARVVDLYGDDDGRRELLLIGYSLMKKDGEPGAIRNFHPVFPLEDLPLALIAAVKTNVIPLEVALQIQVLLSGVIKETYLANLNAVHEDNNNPICVPN